MGREAKPTDRYCGLRFAHPPYSRYTSTIACQMRALVAGMSRYLTETGARASITALTIAGKAPAVPASPAPLAPKGLRFVGTGLLSTFRYGKSSARGVAHSLPLPLSLCPASG